MPATNSVSWGLQAEAYRLLLKETPGDNAGWSWLPSNHPKLPPSNWWVGWGRVSRSRLSGMSRSHQANIDSDLAMCVCVRGGGFNISKMSFACRLHWQKAQQRDNGGYPSTPRPEATQLSFSVCLWHLMNCCPSTEAQGEFLRACKSVHRPSKGPSRYPVTSCLTQTTRIPTDFPSQILWVLLFLAL